jgi:hypothetical protein
MIFMGAGPLLGPLEGVGSEKNLDFFGPKRNSLRSLPIQGLKSLDFQVLPLQMTLEIDFPS